MLPSNATAIAVSCRLRDPSADVARMRLATRPSPSYFGIGPGPDASAGEPIGADGAPDRRAVSFPRRRFSSRALQEIAATSIVASNAAPPAVLARLRENDARRLGRRCRTIPTSHCFTRWREPCSACRIRDTALDRKELTRTRRIQDHGFLETRPNITALQVTKARLCTRPASRLDSYLLEESVFVWYASWRQRNESRKALKQVWTRAELPIRRKRLP